MREAASVSKVQRIAWDNLLICSCDKWQLRTVFYASGLLLFTPLLHLEVPKISVKFPHRFAHPHPSKKLNGQARTWDLIKYIFKYKFAITFFFWTKPYIQDIIIIMNQTRCFRGVYYCVIMELNCAHTIKLIKNALT